MDIAYEVIFLEAAQIGEKYMPAQKKFRDSIHAKGTEITVLSTGDSNDYISLTDIARYKSDAPDDVIKTGCTTVIQSNSSVYGSSSTTRISNPSNSTGLERRPARMRLPYN